MQLYRTSKGNVLKANGASYLVEGDWNSIINRDDLADYLASAAKSGKTISAEESDSLIKDHLLSPVVSQEVWASGVTYLKSRDARMEESKDSGGADCYQKVYDAKRPELFFKSTPGRVIGQGGTVLIRKDSTWNVPEPELTLYIAKSGKIVAYTIGNDMSSRSIEGENPLYLPQAKVYQGSASVGPCLYIPEGPIDPETNIHMKIFRNDVEQYDGETPISRIKRTLNELAEYLFLGLDFEDGAFLMTGTCLVPPTSFTLAEGDRVEITIDGIGTLVNFIGLR